MRVRVSVFFVLVLVYLIKDDTTDERFDWWVYFVCCVRVRVVYRVKVFGAGIDATSWLIN